MITSVDSLFDLSIDQCVTAIQHGGNKRTVLVQGDMGCGKSSILAMLRELLKTTHKCFYFDCTTKTDGGDIGLPRFNLIDEAGCVTYVPNEELGFHLDGPIVLMIDEYGKANTSVKNSLLRVMQEREWGMKKLHPDSLVFATTNLGAEGVGDILQPHSRNRISVVRMRKPNNLEWIEWALNNNVDHTLLGWCKDNPHLFHSFTEVDNPEDNLFIFHPQQQRAAFVTPRSLESASDWMHVRNAGHIDDNALTGLLMGTIGAPAAHQLMTFVNMADQLPSLDSIKTSPKTATVPTSKAALCMVVFRTLGCIDSSWVDAWMDYMERVDTEAQGMFVNGVRSAKYNKQSLVMTNRKFTQWAVKNAHLYSADKV